MAPEVTYWRGLPFASWLTNRYLCSIWTWRKGTGRTNHQNYHSYNHMMSGYFVSTYRYMYTSAHLYAQLHHWTPPALSIRAKHIARGYPESVIVVLLILLMFILRFIFKDLLFIVTAGSKDLSTRPSVKKPHLPLCLVVFLLVWGKYFAYTLLPLE